MNYTLIGTGNMGWFLAQRLKAAGFACKGVYGRFRANAQELAATIEAPVLQRIDDINDSYDCCILAVADHAIPEVAHQLKFNDTPVIHTAGAVSLDVLKTEHRSVLWLVYSIVKTKLPWHRNIPVIVEASDTKAKEITLAIAHAVSDVVHEVNWEQRQWLHLTAVFGNNFINHLMTICEKLCSEQNLPFSILLPILEQTLERVKTLSPVEVQTGPAKRGDTATIEKHINMLQAHPDWHQIYKSISASIEDLYKNNSKGKL